MQRVLVDVELEQAEHPSLGVDEGGDVVGSCGEQQRDGEGERGDAIAVQREPVCG